MPDQNRRFRIIALICALIVFLLWYFRPWIYFFPVAPPPIVNEPLPTEPAPEEPQAIVFTGEPVVPVKIRIEKIQVDADIVPVTADKQGNMATTSEPYGVTWYKNGASPGWSSNAIFAGHNYWNGTPGSFVDLHTLAYGDEVVFDYQDGSRGLFRVKSIGVYQVVPTSDIPASTMTLSGDTRVTLITCAGENVPSMGGFTHRVVVLLDPIDQLTAEEASAADTDAGKTDAADAVN